MYFNSGMSKEEGKQYRGDLRPRAKSYLEFYINYFGEQKLRCLEIFPAQEEGLHVEILDRGFLIPENVDELEKALSPNLHTHPCWCTPELIYADDEKGNEVWLHKRVQ